MAQYNLSALQSRLQFYFWRTIESQNSSRSSIGASSAGNLVERPASPYCFGPTQVSITSHLALRCSATGFLKSWP